MTVETSALGGDTVETIVEIRQRDPYTLVVTEQRDDQDSVIVTEIYRVKLVSQPPAEDGSMDHDLRTDGNVRLQWSYLGPLRSDTA